MTKKRFEIIENSKNYLRIDDKTKKIFYLNEKEIVECLNTLHEENKIFRLFLELNDFDVDEIIRQGKGLE